MHQVGDLEIESLGDSADKAQDIYIRKTPKRKDGNFKLKPPQFVLRSVIHLEFEFVENASGTTCLHAM